MGFGLIIKGIYHPKGYLAIFLGVFVNFWMLCFGVPKFAGRDSPVPKQTNMSAPNS